jgi:prepilin-type N-terminal cleavage/methylation domain-containing protein
MLFHLHKLARRALTAANRSALRRFATRRPRRWSSQAGMSLTELLVVVVIIGILAAAARPVFRRDRVSGEGKEFATVLARTLQQARFQAIAERTPMRAFVFSDRVEVRPGVPTANVNEPPRAATIADPISRVISGRTGITVYDVKTTAGAPTVQLSTTTHKIVEWSTTGSARVVGVTSNFIALYIRNTNTGVSTAARDFRIDIAPLTGTPSLSEAW